VWFFSETVELVLVQKPDLNCCTYLMLSCAGDVVFMELFSGHQISAFGLSGHCLYMSKGLLTLNSLQQQKFVLCRGPLLVKNVFMRTHA